MSVFVINCSFCLANFCVNELCVILIISLATVEAAGSCVKKARGGIYQLRMPCPKYQGTRKRAHQHYTKEIHSAAQIEAVGRYLMYVICKYGK